MIQSVVSNAVCVSVNEDFKIQMIQYDDNFCEVLLRW